MRVLLVAVLLSAGALPAQIPWSLEQIRARYAEQNAPAGPRVERQGGPPVLAFGSRYRDGFADVSRFLRRMQVRTPGADFGGIWEGEAFLNRNPRIYVQTDNTTESIWVWSHLRALTGDRQYDQPVADAWQYVLNHPAWLEEFPNNQYYRVYNCGWALIAEPHYRAVSGDASHLGYARQCADFIVANPLIRSVTVELFTESWAIVGLYRFGVEQNVQSYVDHALARARRFKPWLEANTFYFGVETWALSGGVPFWSILNTTFAANPEGRRGWAQTFGQYLKTHDQTGQWHSAHNGWYALAHATAWQKGALVPGQTRQRWLVERLMAEDTDNDGGIPTAEARPDTQDESWVSNYLAFMGLSPLERAVDPRIEPQSYVVPRGGTLRFELALSHNEPVAGIAYLLLFARLPSTPWLLLDLTSQLVAAKSEAGTGMVSVSFPVNAPLGDWGLAAIAIDGQLRMSELREMHFVVR